MDLLFYIYDNMSYYKWLFLPHLKNKLINNLKKPSSELMTSTGNQASVGIKASKLKRGESVF